MDVHGRNTKVLRCWQSCWFFLWFLFLLLLLLCLLLLLLLFLFLVSTCDNLISMDQYMCVCYQLCHKLPPKPCSMLIMFPRKIWWVFTSFMHPTLGYYIGCSSSYKLIYNDTTVGGFKHGFYLPCHIWDVILPIDEVHHFSRWLLHHQPVSHLNIILYNLHIIPFYFFITSIEICSGGPASPTSALPAVGRGRGDHQWWELRWGGCGLWHLPVGCACKIMCIYVYTHHFIYKHIYIHIIYIYISYIYANI